MRLLVILVVALGCSHKSAPTGDWCGSYVNELRARATADIHAMTLNAANRRHGSEELRAMVGSDPAIHVALEVCSDAAGDAPDRWEARTLRLIDQQAKLADYVLLHGDTTLDDAQTKELTRMVDELADTYTAR